MEASLSEAFTVCPNCKQDVLLSETPCPHCGASADTTSPFLSFRRADGSAGMVDQVTVEYLRSRHSQPDQTDLDSLFARTTRVRLMEMVFEGNTGRFQPRLEFTSAEELSALKTCLTVRPADGHLMTFGEFNLEFYVYNELAAQIEIVRHCLLRWSGRWKNDAYLIDPIGLAEFFKSHGFAAFRESIDREAEAAEKSAAEHAAWEATWEPAIPVGLAPLVEDLTYEKYAAEPKIRPRALALLAVQYSNVVDQILALFAWYGHGSGPWNGYPSSEMAPEYMLESYTAQQMLHALESQHLSRQHLEGAARFVTRGVSKQRKLAQRELVDAVRMSGIRQQILDYVQSTGDSDKIEAVVRRLG